MSPGREEIILLSLRHHTQKSRPRGGIFLFPNEFIRLWARFPLIGVFLSWFPLSFSFSVFVFPSFFPLPILAGFFERDRSVSVWLKADSWLPSPIATRLQRRQNVPPIVLTIWLLTSNSELFTGLTCSNTPVRLGSHPICHPLIKYYIQWHISQKPVATQYGPIGITDHWFQFHLFLSFKSC